MTFMLLIHIRKKIEEDDPNNLGRLSKEVLAQDEYRGRNLFYYVFCRCEHDVEFRANHNSYWGYGLFQVIKRVGKSHFDDYFTTSMFTIIFAIFILFLSSLMKTIG